jgi:hypothetical protein
MKYRRCTRSRKKTDASIARRYARFGDFRGLAMWLDAHRDEWHPERATTARVYEDSPR